MKFLNYFFKKQISTNYLIFFLAFRYFVWDFKCDQFGRSKNKRIKCWHVFQQNSIRSITICWIRALCYFFIDRKRSKKNVQQNVINFGIHIDWRANVYAVSCQSSLIKLIDLNIVVSKTYCFVWVCARVRQTSTTCIHIFILFSVRIEMLANETMLCVQKICYKPTNRRNEEKKTKFICLKRDAICGKM